MKIDFKMSILFFRSNRSLYSLVSLRPLPADYEPSVVTLPGTCPLQGDLQTKDYFLSDTDFQIEDIFYFLGENLMSYYSISEFLFILPFLADFSLLLVL